MTKRKRIHHSTQMVWKRTNRYQQMAAWMALTMTRVSSKYHFVLKILSHFFHPQNKYFIFSVRAEKKQKHSIKIYRNLIEGIRHTRCVYVHLANKFIKCNKPCGDHDGPWNRNKIYCIFVRHTFVWRSDKCWNRFAIYQTSYVFIHIFVSIPALARALFFASHKNQTPPAFFLAFIHIHINIHSNS